MVCDAWEEPLVTSATRGTTQQRKRRATCQSMAIRSRRLRARQLRIDIRTNEEGGK